MQNPLLVPDSLPRFADIRPEHVVPAVREMLAKAYETLEELERSAQPTWESFMEPLDLLDRDMQRVWGPVAHLNGVMNTPELRDAYNTVLPEIVTFGLRLGQSERFFALMKEMRDSKEWDSMSPDRRRSIELGIRGARLSGVDLSPEKRERFNAISKRLSELSTKFRNNHSDAIKAFELVLTTSDEVAGLPASVLARASQAFNQAHPDRSGEVQSGPWLFTLDRASYLPFMKNARRRDLREKLWRANACLATEGQWDNRPLIREILQLRAEKAALLGFRNYAELSLASKMAPSIDSVQDLLDAVRTPARKRGAAELAAITALARSEGHTGDLEWWDLQYWFRAYKEKELQLDEEALRAYFPLPRVLDGLFALIDDLFEVKVTAADGKAPVWHPDVRLFEIRSKAGEPIASLYFDLFSRPATKRSGAWFNNCVSRRRVNGHVELPAGYICANITPPVDGKPSYLTLAEVTTLFHETGHALQGLLTQIDTGHVSGISGVEWDAVELASQFLQEWCTERRTLKRITCHETTGEVIPDELIRLIEASRNWMMGYSSALMTAYSETDLVLHSSFDAHGAEEPASVYHRIGTKNHILPVREEDHFLCGFSHIFAGGYAMGYYSYLWSEVLSSDVFAAFEEAGFDDASALKRIGAKYRDTVLALGGSVHPREVFRAFRGRDADPQAFLRSRGLT